MTANNPENTGGIPCFVCGSRMRPYFSKNFNTPWLEKADYTECPGCGFVVSKTHLLMPQNEWERLNEEYHKSYQGADSCADDPKWLDRLQIQADVIADLRTLGLLPVTRPWVDYGCGNGKLSDLLGARHGIGLLKYDRYMEAPDYVRAEELSPGKFDLVVSTSVLEHVRERAAMDEIAAMVSETGVFGLHTLVMERIPADPEWFYLLPVHCSFYSNESMRRLFKAWGFTSSIYHVEARLWMFFKGEPGAVEGIIAKANARPEKMGFYYHYKRGFMDYWK